MFSKLTSSSMTPVSMTAVIVLSLARSRAAVVRAGYSWCLARAGGRGDGNSEMPLYH